MRSHFTLQSDAVLRSASITLLAFIAVSACFGGGMLIADPSGRFLGLSTSLLASTPFESYLIPGMILFILLGGGSFLTIAAIIRIVWVSPILLAANGVCVTTWIIIQMKLIETVLPQQLIVGFIGLILIALGVLQWDQRSETHK